ncbi:MAG: hypothetical protein KF708_14135 [Pirellulales bacterium]|nr:hypothetical protein [Pirellulales bacterium]
MLRAYLSILLLALSSTLTAEADDLAELARPQSGVLVLRGGQVLEGEITQAGDNYYLTLPTGEISIRAADVAFRCQDLGEAYRRRRESIQWSLVDERIKFIEWCLKYELYAPAAREIAEAKGQWPADPRLAALERRMLLRDQTARSSAAAPAASSEPSFEELDQMVRKLPPRAASMFTNTIQPLLLNQCATAACHGAQRTNDFALHRSSVSNAPSRRLTLRNLGHALAQVDRQHPEASPLLTQPTGLGDSAHAIILGDPSSAGYKDLVAWVRLVAGNEPQTARAPRPNANSALLQFAPSAGDASQGKSGNSSKPTAARNKAPARHEVPATTGLTFSTNQRGGLIRPDGSFDPLDPDDFNRRFFPERFDVKFFDGLEEDEPAEEASDESLEAVE